MNDIKLCKDCRYFRQPTLSPTPHCTKVPLSVDYVTGVVRYAPAAVERQGGTCGPSGVLWEPIPEQPSLWQRIKLCFKKENG